MAESFANPYAVLEISLTATLDEIKQAYFAQVRLHPPEREPEAFKRIRAAYDQLKTPEKRIEADMRLLEEWPARGARAPELDLSVHPEDVLTIFKAETDLERANLRQDFREVRL
jgi:curved DNA-binding protein CbpA